MSLTHDIGRGILGIVLLIISSIILLFGVGILLFGNDFLVGLIAIIIGGGIAIASRQRIYGH